MVHIRQVGTVDAGVPAAASIPATTVDLTDPRVADLEMPSLPVVDACVDGLLATMPYEGAAVVVAVVQLATAGGPLGVRPLEAGDVRRRAAQRVRSHLGPGHWVGVMPGGQLVVMGTLDEGVPLCWQLGEDLEQAFHQPIAVDGRSWRVHPRIGLATLAHGALPDAAAEAREVVRSAVQDALVAAATATSSQPVHARAGANHVLDRMLQIEGALARAYDGDGLVLHYQPQVDAVTGELVGVESLARLEAPEGGLFMPAEFLPLIDRGRDARAFAIAVLTMATRDAALIPDLDVAVNLRPAVLDVLDAADILDITRAQGMPADKLIIEVTEEIGALDQHTVSDLFVMLRRAGVRLSMDDYGTGHSGAVRLAEHPFDVLKIDRSLIMNASDPRYAEVLSSTVHLARRLFMTTVAEGVENPIHLATARQAGCDQVQGFLIAPPMPLEDLVAWRQGWPSRVDDAVGA